MKVLQKKNTHIFPSSPIVILSLSYPIVLILFFILLGFLYMQRSSPIGSIDGIGAAGFGLLYYMSLNGISAYIVLIGLYYLFGFMTKKKLHTSVFILCMFLTIPCGIALSIFGLVSPIIRLYEYIVF